MLKNFFTDSLAKKKIERAKKVKSLEECRISEQKSPLKFSKSFPQKNALKS